MIMMKNQKSQMRTEREREREIASHSTFYSPGSSLFSKRGCDKDICKGLLQN